MTIFICSRAIEIWILADIFPVSEYCILDKYFRSEIERNKKEYRKKYYEFRHQIYRIRTVYITIPMIVVRIVPQTVSIATIFHDHPFITLILVSSQVIYAPNPKSADLSATCRSVIFPSTHGMTMRTRSTSIQSRQKATAATQFISVLRYVGIYFLNVGSINFL